MVSAPLHLVDDDGKTRLRLWIRLLRVARSLESELRERLHLHFATTLPRFDVMAALARTPDGMLMGALSRYLLVSNGNITGIVDRLVSDGVVSRDKVEGDRRASIIRLTAAGRAQFDAMAAAHSGWVDELLAGISPADARTIAGALKAFRSSWENDA